jgi:hypothetical protein
LQEWHNDINASNKLSLFSRIKTNYEIEPYLQCIRYKNIYSVLAKFRISNHKLIIETGRYENIEWNKRLCKICQKSDICVIEDECHFILKCPVYADIRKKYLSFMSVYRGEDAHKLIRLLKTHNPDEINQTALYIKEAFKLRSLLFESVP